jgi:hypothetical protein
VLETTTITTNIAMQGIEAASGSSEGVFTIDFDLVRAAFGTALALVMVGAALGEMILPVVAQTVVSRT